jgi:hypothetical protein
VVVAVIVLGAASVLLAGALDARFRGPGPSASVTGSAPASWPVAVGCRGAQCTGRGALDMACSVDAASYADLHVAGAYLELRISDECQAAWARVAHAVPGEQLQVTTEDGGRQAALIRGPAGTGQYLATRMVRASRHSEVRACLVARTGQRWCTQPGAQQRVDVPAPGRQPTTPASLR